jgi:hypothetical protein
MRIVMPLFDFEYESSQEFIFGDGNYSLRKFFADEEMPQIDLFSKQDIDYMRMKSWALVAENSDIKKYKQEVNILLLSFKIYKLAPLFIKYRLCKEDDSSCFRLNKTMQYVLREKSNRLITLNDLDLVNNGFLNLLTMHPISNRTQNSLYFLYRGFHSTRMIDSFVFLMSAIESLFSSEKRGGMTKTICSRVSNFLDHKTDCKYEDINKLYDLRSKIVHGKLVVSDDTKGHLGTLHKLEYVVTQCMKKILDNKIYKIYNDVQKKDHYFNELINRVR